MVVQEKLNKQNEHIAQYIYEREKELHFLNLSILAKQHMMMLGLPGIAKSEMARYKFAHFVAKMFYNNCHSYTVPSDLIGMQIVDRIKLGILEYRIENMLPDCTFAILDEVFKVAKALSSLLPILHERKFKNGEIEIDIPLNNAVLISNELPSDPEIKGAFFDRCPIRFEVSPIADDENLTKLVKKSFLNPFQVIPENIIEKDELSQAQKEVKAINLSDETIEAVRDIFRAVNSEGIYVSDRQFFQFASIIKSEAFMNGRTVTDPEDCHVLTETMWHEPKQRKTVADIVNGFVNTNLIKINEIFDMACAEYDSWKKEAQAADHKAASARMKLIRSDFENLPVKKNNSQEHSTKKNKIVQMHGEMMKYALQQAKLGR